MLDTTGCTGSMPIKKSEPAISVTLNNGTAIDCPIIRKFNMKGLFGRLISKEFNRILQSKTKVEISVIIGGVKKKKVLVKVDDLIKRYELGKEEIKSAAKEGVLENLIKFKIGNIEIDEFKEKLRNQFQFNSRLKCYEFITHQNERIRTALTIDDLELYVHAVAAFKFVSPPSEPLLQGDHVWAHCIRVTSAPHHMVKICEGQEEKIIALFGKVIGTGGYAIVTHTLDMATGELTEAKHSMAAYRAAHGEPNEEEIEASLIGAKMIRSVHAAAPSGIATGIQVPLIAVKDKVRGHLGFLSPKYEGSLAREEFLTSITSSLALEAGSQLVQGLVQMHRKKIAHRDIKLDNILVNRGSSDAEWQFHHADFDGAVMHDGRLIHALGTCTTRYRPREDIEAYKREFEIENVKEMQQIDEKGDVFALASVLYVLLMKEFPFVADNEDHPTFNINEEELKRRLIGILPDKPDIVNMIAQGLSRDYRERPSAEGFATLFQGSISEAPCAIP